MLALALVSPVFLVDLGAAYAYLDLTRIRQSAQTILHAKGISPRRRSLEESGIGRGAAAGFKGEAKAMRKSEKHDAESTPM